MSLGEDDSQLKFNCNGCGKCCKAIKCPLLTEDNKCSIYDTRPLLCNVEKGYDVLFKDKMTRVEFYKLNEAVCKKLQEEIE
jgi:Fe-S-cluster containining protein